MFASTARPICGRRRNGELELKRLGGWKDVRILDADDIEQWMELAPGVAASFACQMGCASEGVDHDVVSRWAAIAASTKKTIDAKYFLFREKKRKGLKNG